MPLHKSHAMPIGLRYGVAVSAHYGRRYKGEIPPELFFTGLHACLQGLGNVPYGEPRQIKGMAGKLLERC